MSKSEAASLALTATKKTIGVGSSYDFNIKNKVKGSTYKWTSSNTKVATVNSKNGLTTAKAEGTAKISVKITLPKKAGTKTLTATVTVKKYVDATSVKISNPITAMEIGAKHDFNRTMSPEGANNKTYWIVKDAAGKEVANTRTGVGASLMDSKGVFKPVEGGVYTITAECWRSKTATVKRAESEALKVVVGGVVASQTGVKTIKVVGANSTTLSDYVVKRGASTVALKSVEIKDGVAYLTTMSSRMIAGDYTVTYKNGAASPFTAVDEKLTKIETIGTDLIKDSNDATKATIGFRAYNQFNETMSHNDLSLTCTLGTATVKTPATASKDGVIEVTNNNVYDLVVGKTGTLIIVDQKTGVTCNTPITVAASKSISSVVSKGLYNTTDKKFVELTAGDDVSSTYLILEIKDQYGNIVSEFNNGTDLVFTESAGLTGLSLATATTVTIDNVKYAAIPLQGTPAEGSFNVIVVSPIKGLLATVTIPVAKATIIKSFSFSPVGDVYSNSDNELSFVAIDSTGKELTKFSELNGKISFTSKGNVRFIAGKDGAAKLVYTPSAKGYDVITATCNSGADVFVTVNTVNVKDAKLPREIVGIDKDVALAAIAGQTLTINQKDLIIEDQFGNVMTDAEVGSATSYKIKVAAAEGTGFNDIAANDNIPLTSGGGTIVNAVSKAKGEITVKLTLNDGTNDISTYEVTFKAATINDVSNLSIKDFKYVQKASGKVAPEVIGSYAGETVVLPADTYTITDENIPALGTEKKTVTGSVEVTVDTKTPTVLTKEYQYSNEDKKLTYMTAKDTINVTGTVGTAIKAADFNKAVDLKDQYGDDIAAPSTLKYNITYISVDKTSVKYNQTNRAEFTPAVAGTYSVTVTYSYGSLSCTVNYDIVVS